MPKALLRRLLAQTTESDVTDVAVLQFEVVEVGEDEVKEEVDGAFEVAFEEMLRDRP